MKPVIALLVLALAAFAKHPPASIPAGSAVYIEPGNGADLIREVFEAKNVPLRFTPFRDEADYILDTALVTGSIEVENNGHVANFSRTYGSVWLESKSGQVVWKYIVDKRIVNRGNRAMAEAAASHVGEAIIKPRK